MNTQWWYVFQALTILFLFLLNYLADLLLRMHFPGFRGWKRALFWLTAAASIAVYALARTAIFREIAADSPIKYFIYAMIVWDIALAGILLSWPLCRLAALTVRDTPHDPRRRKFIRRALALTSAASVAGALGGVVAAESTLIVQRRTLSFANLPAGLDGLKVVQFSDSHLGLFFSLERWNEVLALVKQEKPDLLLVTGDVVDDLELLSPALAKLAALRPSIPCGIFACLGNHEYFRDVSFVRRTYAAAGIPLLTNENRRLTLNNTDFYLLAADYPLTRNPAERSRLCREFVDLAADGVPRKAFSLLMAHHPDFINEGFRRGISLTVAGHTHGAQVGWGERSLFEGAFSYTRGLYQLGVSYGFVSSGVGHWLPFRLACPPEIVSFTFKQANPG